MKFLLIIFKANIMEDVDPLGFAILFLGILLGLVVICIALSYYIARARRRVILELRERHSPSRDQE